MSLALLERLAQRGAIRWLSYYFAEFAVEQCAGDADELLAYSAALVSEAHLDGDVCVELGGYVGAPLFGDGQEAAMTPRGVGLDDWRARLAAAPCVGAPGELAPLVIDGDCLYLYRYWHYESRVAECILEMLAAEGQPVPGKASANTADLDRDQAAAVARAAQQRFSVISGGPGSGKTSTVVRILDALLRRDPTLRIALTAPTGKAAARLMDSIRARLEAQANSHAVGLPKQATTIHRLLGARGGGFVHGRGHTLPVDCVIVDEASMVDLRLMHQLLEALPANARLILLGDRDQLASVAAGNVLGDITGHGHPLDVGAAPLAGAISLLRGAYRFGGDSAIGKLAGRINGGDVAGAVELLRTSPDELEWYEQDGETPPAALLERIVDAYQPIFEGDDPLAALAVYDSIRVLCATNAGPHGVNRLNAEISAALAARNGLGEGPIEHGQPILIGRNHHALGLYNGDTGILWRRDGALQACFRNESGELRCFGVHRLSGYQPAWAVTVHKSQGSEFDSVALLLGNDPAAESLSRELFYTAVTRARRRLILHGSPELVGRAITRLTRRHSGLARRLGWPA